MCRGTSDEVPSAPLSDDRQGSGTGVNIDMFFVSLCLGLVTGEW